MSTLTYIKNFIRDPRVASITPTSSHGVQRICEKIDFGKARVIVEYGPGTGIITNGFLEQLRPDAQLILIERNENFAAILQRKLQDPRVSVFHEDARNVLAVLQSQEAGLADYIVSGIPFSLVGHTVRKEIVHNTYKALRPGGKFIAYQTFWQPDEHLFNHLQENFQHADDEFVLLNAPPIRLYEARKGVTVEKHPAAVRVTGNA